MASETDKNINWISGLLFLPRTHDNMCSCTSSYVSTTQDGWTPLITAAVHGHRDVVIELLDNGADINAQSNVTQLHISLSKILMCMFIISMT